METVIQSKQDQRESAEIPESEIIRANCRPFLRDIYNNPELAEVREIHLEEGEIVLCMSDFHISKSTTRQFFIDVLDTIDSVNPSKFLVSGDFLALFENMFIYSKQSVQYTLSTPLQRLKMDNELINEFFENGIDRNLLGEFFIELGERAQNNNLLVEIMLGNHDLNYHQTGRINVIQQIYKLIPNQYHKYFKVGSDIVKIYNSRGKQISKFEHGNGLNGIPAIHEFRRQYFPHLPFIKFMSDIGMYLGDNLVRPLSKGIAFVRKHTDFADDFLRGVLDKLDNLTPLDHYHLYMKSNLENESVTPIYSHLHDAIIVEDNHRKVKYINTGKGPNDFLVQTENGKFDLYHSTSGKIVKRERMPLMNFKERYNGELEQ